MSYNRPTQSKAQNESNAKILRALVKQPDNKVCADCKRNDPRWASWNIGCFLCIRCSGIHRSMGTHISKVKSIDLDIWTPEQMQAIQRWGNRLSNLYWEAHLKAGHVPPDHKVESFIRSKYEMRRWAKDGPVPSDPSVLDGGQTSSVPSSAAAASPSASVSSKAVKATALDLLGGDATTSAATTSVSKGSRNLLDDFDAPPPAPTNGTSRAQPAAAVPAKNAQNSSAVPKATPSAPASSGAGGGGGGLFDLDWQDGPAAGQTSVPSTTFSSGSKGSKNDILSLYASAKPLSPATGQQPTSPGQTSFAGLNTSFSGMSMSSTGAAPANAAPSSSPWASNSHTSPPANNASLFGATTDPWASSAPSTGAAFGATSGNDIWGNATASTNATSNSASLKRNDAFDDIWSDFK